MKGVKEINDGNFKKLGIGFQFSIPFSVQYYLSQKIIEKIRLKFPYLNSGRYKDKELSLNYLIKKEYEILFDVEELRDVFHIPKDEDIEKTRKFAEIRILVRKISEEFKKLSEKEIFIKTGKEIKQGEYIINKILEKRK